MIGPRQGLRVPALLFPPAATSESPAESSALWLSDSESSQCAADLSIIESVTGQGCNLNVCPRVLPRPGGNEALAGGKQFR
jgi:hypothetical protein